MTITITGGHVDVFKPGNTSNSPNTVLKTPDLQGVTVKHAVQGDAGSGKIVVNNIGGEYAGEVTAGDRLEFVVEIGDIEDTSSATFYGRGTYGGGSYGTPSGDRRRWTGMATIPRYQFDGPESRTMTIDAQPFAFAVMGSLGRKVDNTFRERTVGFIAQSLLADEAEELDPSGIQDFPDTTVDVEYDGTPVLKAMKELADEADAILSADGRAVSMRPIDDVPLQWTAKADDFGTWGVDETDDELYNQVRVEGGIDNKEGDTQETQTEYQTLTEGDPIAFQIELPKSRTNQVDIWTRAEGSEDSLTLGIQEDIDGSPTDIGDETKDLVKNEQPHHFLSDDDFTQMDLKPTELPDPRPWVILRAQGDDGIDIGVDGSGTPAYEGYYYYPIITQKPDQDSIDEYRRREHRIKKDTITSSRTAASIASRTLRRSRDPRKEFSADAQSRRAHDLRPGGAITLNFPKETAVGGYIAVSRTDTYAPSGASNQLQTDLRLEEIETF